jgi:glycosyltransferase involved in cell wall biosynthesis
MLRFGGTLKELKVTIGIPTYNRSEYVVRAIRSALAQTYRNLEVVVSDNASSDNTVDRIREIDDPRLRFIEQTKNLGMTGNFNCCLKAATGDLFLLLSDDDLLGPDAVERLSGPFRQDSSDEISIVWCPVHILDAAANPTYVTTAGPARESGLELVEGLFRGTRGPRLCGIMLRREEALRFGGYQESHGPICDVGLWTRVALSHSCAICVPEPLVSYTVHSASISSRPNGVKWQRSGEQITSDLVALLDSRGEVAAARRIKAAGHDITSNLLATVMMQYMGKPGWIRYWLSEAFRAPNYLFAPVVFKRLLKDGRKLVRLRSSS